MSGLDQPHALEHSKRRASIGILATGGKCCRQSSLWLDEETPVGALAEDHVIEILLEEPLRRPAGDRVHIGDLEAVFVQVRGVSADGHAGPFR